MAKPQMLAAGIVESGGGTPGVVAAFVAVAAGPRGSRMFKVSGPASGPEVVELSGATTIDLRQMQQEVQRVLEPALLAIGSPGGQAAITRPSADWVCDAVRQHLAASEGLELD